MKRFFGVLAILFPLLASAQVIVGNFGVNYVPNAPSGNCSKNALIQIVLGAGTVYTCQSGTWTQIVGGGGAINPTNNVIPVRSNGTTFIDSPLTVNSGVITDSGDFHFPSVLGAGDTYGGAPWSIASLSSPVVGGFTDNTFSFGYNAGPLLQPIIAGKPVMGWEHEVDWLQNGDHWMETHFDYSVDGVTYQRPVNIGMKMNDTTYGDFNFKLGDNVTNYFTIGRRTGNPALNVSINGDILEGTDNLGSIGQSANYRPANVYVATTTFSPRIEVQGGRLVFKNTATDSVADAYTSGHDFKVGPDQSDGNVIFMDSGGNSLLTYAANAGNFTLKNLNAGGFTRLDVQAGASQSTLPLMQWKDVNGNINTTIKSDGTLQAVTYSTATNCSNGASPAVCGAAASGVVAVPTGTNPTLVINTTAVTSTSRIFLGIDESATIAATTCNTTLSTLVQPVVTARAAATSFTIQIGAILAGNPACVSYFIVN